MKICHTVLCGAMLSLAAPSFAAVADLHPTPQNATVGQSRIDIGGGIRLVGADNANPRAVNALRESVSESTDKNAPKLVIGELGDRSVRKFARSIPSQPEGYFLKIGDNEIVVAGTDERGTWNGVQTLLQLVDDGTLPEATITDYPAIAHRGVVEGFYGKPWSFDDRVSQLKLYGRRKMNTYIYGPKDDPYHSSPNWRLPYPEAEAKRLSELTRVAADNEVDFVWAIHPGKDIKWNDEDRQNLVDKFNSMYDLGVRGFAVFFDDIEGDGTDPVRQAQLLNYLDENFVRTKPDIATLMICPTEYNRAWSHPEKGYLTTLGDSLNQTVKVMWTGDDVIATIDPQGMRWINARIDRPAFIWWNWPVSDYVQDHLLMGPAEGNDPSIAPLMSGFVANPMEHSEASKIGIMGVADYAWNPEAFDARASWLQAIETVLPEAPEALACLATHNSDMGPNQYKYGVRDESRNIAPQADRFIDAYLNDKPYDKADLALLIEEMERIEDSADILLGSKGNPQLISEIKPWLIQFKLVGQLGQAVFSLVEAVESGNDILAERKAKAAKSLKEQIAAVDSAYNQDKPQPGVKTASKIVVPLLDKTLDKALSR